MKPFHRPSREISDIHRSGPWYAVFYRRNIVNLQKKLRTRNFWIWAALVVVAIAAVFFAGQHPHTQADVKDFYPLNCLGDWQNPQNAQRQPDTVLDAGASFSASTSAVDGASSTQIFCNNFLPDNFATSGIITNVGVTLVWQIGDAATSSADLEIATDTENVASSTDIASSTDAVSSTDASDTIDMATTTTDTTSSTDAASSTDAVASSTDVVASSTNAARSTDVVASSTDAASSSDIIASSTDTTDAESTSSTSLALPKQWFAFLLKAALADDAMVSGTDAIIDGSDTLPLAPEMGTSTPASDDNFLDVSYSTDGQLWTDLKKVDLSNWPNLTFTLPIANWADLQNLEVRITNISSTQDPLPPVYLDAILLEIHYDDPSGIPNDASVYPHFSMEGTEYAAGDQIDISGAPPESFIEIYALDDLDSPDVPANDYALQVDNDGATSIDTNTLAPGRYILVNTFEPLACNEYLLSECRARTDYIGETEIQIDPAQGQSSTP